MDLDQKIDSVHSVAERNSFSNQQDTERQRSKKDRIERIENDVKRLTNSIDDMKNDILDMKNLMIQMLNNKIQKEEELVQQSVQKQSIAHNPWSIII